MNGELFPGVVIRDWDGGGRGKDYFDPFEIETETEPHCFRISLLDGPDLEETF